MATIKNSQYSGKHLTFQERKLIESELQEGATLQTISHVVSKDPRTISKEIRRNRSLRSYAKKRAYTGYELATEACSTTDKYPFTCNHCERRHHCMRDHFYYQAEDAQRSYEALLRDSRVGIDMTRSEFETLDYTLRQGTQLGQSIYAISQSNPTHITCSTRSIYRYVDRGYLSTKPIDLRNKVKMKPRKKHYDYTKTLQERESVKGRSLTDYFQFLTDYPGVLPVQLDTVEGAKGCRKVFLTLHFVAFHHMWVFLLDSQTPREVVKVFNELQSLFGIALFRQLFPCIVTDRGNEFVDALGIECNSSTGEQRTRLFYCDAYQSNQKGAIESNHRLLRYIVPKGSNLDILEPHHAIKIMTQIANYPLRELNGKTSYEVMAIYFGTEILDLIELKKVDPPKINLTPTLLAK